MVAISPRLWSLGSETELIFLVHYRGRGSTQYAVPGNMHPHPPTQGRSLAIQGGGGGGLQKPKHGNGKYKACLGSSHKINLFLDEQRSRK